MSVVFGLTGLVSCTAAVGAAVVRAGQRAAVVVPEFDHHVVAGLEGGCDFFEVAFARVGAGAAAADGFVGDCARYGGRDVFAPACCLLAMDVCV